MGIYIPGMKMPTSCASCPCANDETPFCRAANKYIPMLGKPEWCPLIELPPHGRLGDLDALEFLYEESADGWRHTPVFMDFFKACAKGVREAPTIIPAEGGASDG